MVLKVAQGTRQLNPNLIAYCIFRKGFENSRVCCCNLLYVTSVLCLIASSKKFCAQKSLLLYANFCHFHSKLIASSEKFLETQQSVAVSYSLKNPSIALCIFLIKNSSDYCCNLLSVTSIQCLIAFSKKFLCTEESVAVYYFEPLSFNAYCLFRKVFENPRVCCCFLFSVTSFLCFIVSSQNFL